MNNAELIAALRCDGKCNKPNCPYSMDDRDWCDEVRIISDAADALEAAEKRIAELEAQLPKDGEWIDLFGHDYKCSVCGEWYRMDGTPEQEDMNYCPNCGARMQTVTECHTLEEGER